VTPQRARLAPAPRRSGFSLLEVLAVVLLTSLVIGVALNHYVNLESATTRAGELTRDVRLATAILDRLARDFESAVFVKPRPGEDPFANQYVFVAESSGSELGADRIKFVTRGNEPRGETGHESDLEVVAYTVQPDPEGLEGDLRLMRWSQPRLPPEGHDISMPGDESEGARPLAEGLASFGVRFVDEAGGELSEWDAAQLTEQQELPVAVEIELALRDPDADPELGVEPPHYFRRVLLPVAALDLQELFDPTSAVSGGSGAEGQEKDDQEGDGDEDGEDVADGEMDVPCMSSPCAGMTACQVIGCQSRLGQHNRSIDLLIESEMRLNRPYCAFRASLGLQRTLVALLVPNPACR
jgi:type II secretory pathway component PulJ